MRRYFLIGVALLSACSTVRPINTAAHSGLCNDEGEACCDEPAGLCDPAQGLGCNALTNKCVFIQNGGACDDIGEPCCAMGCDPDTHLVCDDFQHICVPPIPDSGPCGDFGEPCCAVGDTGDASAESAGCNTGLECVVATTGGREESLCVWGAAGQSQIDVGYGCIDGICRDETLLCHPTTHSCVIGSNGSEECSSWGAPCCAPDGTCRGAGLQCFHGTCTHSPFGA